MDCERHIYGGCRIHYPLGVVQVAEPIAGGSPLLRERFIAHADPVVGIEPAALDSDVITIDADERGAAVQILDRRYDLIGYCEVDEALVAVCA